MCGDATTNITCVAILRQTSHVWRCYDKRTKKFLANILITNQRWKNVQILRAVDFSSLHPLLPHTLHQTTVHQPSQQYKCSFVTSFVHRFSATFCVIVEPTDRFVSGETLFERTKPSSLIFQLNPLLEQFYCLIPNISCMELLLSFVVCDAHGTALEKRLKLRCLMESFGRFIHFLDLN